MKRFMTDVVAIVCAGTLCVGLVACGGGSSSGSTSASSASSAVSTSASPSASPASSSAGVSAAAGQVIDPATINPGWLDSEVRTSDVWHLNGDTSAEGIFFTNAANDAGLSFTRVDANDEEGDGEFNLVITDEKHLRTAGNTAPKIDIVFSDPMTCYDYVTGNLYIRGDLKALQAAVAGNTYVMEGRDDVEVTFNPDGTYTETVKGKSETGTWKVAAATVVEMTYDSDGYVEEYRLTLEDGVATRIMDSGWKYYDLS